MPPTVNRLLLAALLPVMSIACSGGNDRPRETGPGRDGTSSVDRRPVQQIAWDKTMLDGAEAGTQTSLAVLGNTVGIVHFRAAGTPTTHCPAAGGTPATDKPRPAQDLMYVQSTDAALTWNSPVKIDRTIGQPQGTSVAFGSSGSVLIGYLGGEVSTQECASSDAMIATSADGITFSTSVMLGAGPTGDTVGYWMSVAVDSKGTAHAAFGDARYGFYEQDAWRKGSLRFDAAELVCCNPLNGLGWYNALAMDSNDNPVVVSYNPAVTDSRGGIMLALKKSGAWQTHQLVGGATTERLGLGRSTSGKLGVSYHETTSQQLRFLESDSTDYSKVPWTEQVVDTDSFNTGKLSAVAYDSKGNPAVSYYKCGPYNPDPAAAKCDPAKDGLRFAWRKDGVNWSIYDIDAGGNYECGTYTGLGFLSGDQPVIAYRCVSFNSITKEYVGGLWVAKGAMQ